MYDDLKIIHWPDPRLKRTSKPVDTFGPDLAALGAKMLELMRAAKGVGLAAPQVGLNLRLFVMNATGEPADDRVYVNPVLSDPHGQDEREEGCLSLPDINAPMLRSLGVRLRARDLEGGQIEEAAEGFMPRVWQHEIDHLDGVLILDKMSPTARMASRKKLKELEDDYRESHPALAPPVKKKQFGRGR